MRILGPLRVSAPPGADERPPLRWALAPLPGPRGVVREMLTRTEDEMRGPRPTPAHECPEAAPGIAGTPPSPAARIRP